MKVYKHLFVTFHRGVCDLTPDPGVQVERSSRLSTYHDNYVYKSTPKQVSDGLTLYAQYHCLLHVLYWEASTLPRTSASLLVHVMHGVMFNQI